MKCTQLNLNHCEAAQSLLRQAVRDEQTEVVLISEPYRSIPGNGWLASSKEAALWSTETAPQDIRTSSEGIVWANINGVTFYSCYAPPRWEISRYQRMQRSLVADARGRSPVVIGGDFNAWAPDKAGRGFIIDITFVSSALIRKCNWEDSDAYTFSDHQAIHFTLGGVSRKRIPKVTGPKKKDSRLDREALSVTLQTLDRTSSSFPEELSGSLSDACDNACDSAMPRRKPSRRGASVYWWNQDNQQLRTRLRARRRFQRARGSEDLTTRTEEFKAAKRALKL
ncbi:hypothetical protein KR026_007898, partial [Drosophila bipectinata]